AAADNFAGVRRVQGLGHVLRIACDSILAVRAIDGLDVWRQAIDQWESLDETQQAVEVARGMRLLARIPKPAGATITRAIERSTVRAAPVPPSSPSSNRPASLPLASHSNPDLPETKIQSHRATETGSAASPL